MVSLRISAMGSIFIAESLVIGKGYLSHNSLLLDCIVTNLVSSLCIKISNLFEGYLQCSAGASSEWPVLICYSDILLVLLEERGRPCFF